MMMEACCSRFTAAEGGARLAAAAATKNILAVEYASFIPVRLLYEKAYQIRGSLFEGSKRSIYVTRASRVLVVAYELKILTDLGTVAAQAYEDVYDWNAELESKEVLICTSSVLKQILEEQLLSMCNINVLIVDSCHLIYSDDALKYIMNSYKQCPQPSQPIILALTYPLFNSTKKDTERESEKETPREEEMGVYENVDDFNMYEKLEWKIEELESELCCEMDLAEDIDGGKRISSSVTKPRELIIEYGSRPLDEELPEVYRDLEKYMRDTVQDALDFIEDHRHDPTEIYGEELYDEFMNIPDPKLDPKQIFKQFLYILDQLGPYAADKAAFSLLTKLEKLKIKVPYERHFILMCLCTTVFIKIRCYADIVFSKYEDEWERIKTFSTSKIMRFAEILEKFKPPDIKNQNTSLSRLDSIISNQDSRDSGDNETGSVVSGCDSLSRGDSTRKMLSDIDECDFRALGNKLEDKVNTYCSNLREIFDSPTEPCKDSPVNDKDSQNILEQTNIPSNTTSITSSNDTLNSNKPNIPSNSSVSETDITDTANTTTIPDTRLSNQSHKPDTQSDTTSVINIQANDTDVSGSETDSKIDITNKPCTRLNEMNIHADDVSSTDIRVSGMDIKGNEIIVQQRGLLGFPRRAGRLRGRTRMQRNNAARVLQMQQNPDALCGIVFMKEPLIAKIMFMMIVDMSRCNPRLGYLCVQYCATENPADPGTEPRECQRQGKKQEEVLKKFRMHECNLLLATSALEEGIDLPRCNLVLRWDVPVSYRSYGLCRGRARAARATAALLCTNNPDTTQMLLHNIATYRELDQIISRKCGCGIQDEPPQSEEDHADTFTTFIKPYSPNESANYNTSHNIPEKEIKKSSNDDEKRIKTTKISEKGVISSDDIQESVISSDDINESVSSKDIDDVINIKDGEKSVKYNKDIENSVISSKNSETSDQIQKESVYDSKHLAESDNFEVTSNIDLEKGSMKSKICAIEDNIGNSNSEEAANTNICRGNGNSDNDLSKNINEEISNEFLIDNHNVIGGNNNKITDEQPEVDCENGNISILTNKDEAQKIFNYNVVGNANVDELNTVNTENNDLINQIVNKTANININDQTEDNHTQLNDVDMIEINKNIDHQDKHKPNVEQKDEQNIEKIHEQIKEKQKLTSNEANNDISRNDIRNIREFAVKNIPQDSNISKNDIGLSKDNILSRVYCDKCYNVKVSNVCLCSNVNLYYQLLAKPNLSENDIKKNISDCDGATVDLSTAIALINRYCGKLPSDTFTRLAPQWWMEEVSLPVAESGEIRTAYICTLRLPLNCPVKYNIVGHPMPTKVLARRMVALQACRILHMSGELDNQLMPIGKENFKASELDACSVVAYNGASEPNDCARPGTTKRRQYYYKRTAWAFTDCQPVIDTDDVEIYPDADPETMDIDSDIEAPINEGTKNSKPKEVVPQVNAGQKRNMLYAIVSKLWCALPERYNTRGRRLHAPQNASQAIGILMSRDVTDNLQIPAFPVYTRSGEVRVSVEHIPDADVRMSPRRGRLVRRFMRFVFAEVLRVRRRGMRLHTSATTHNYNNYYIVPTIKILQDDGSHKIDIDWAFLELIYNHTEEKKQSDIEKPLLWQEAEEEQKMERDSNKRRKGKKKMANPLLKAGECFVFDAEKYREAVVTPWYRNQDQPQFFLVAEICWNLTPDSSFPSATHQSFRDYYSTKYGVTLTQKEQPLLDVDHTSARLNLLTPRYVNRKGVALPVSSERTRRAKRDRLDQKQILVPELCRVHPFAAPLWFATVALPCVLYRINALLIADEIRRAVAIDVGLGIPKINEKTMPGFQWPALDFGWSLAEVLSADSEKNEKKKEDDESKKEHKGKESSQKEEIEGEQKGIEDEMKEKTINDILQEKEAAEAEAAFEIGTWSNDMASCIPETSEYDELMEPLPPNLTFCTSSAGGTNWCDPIAKPKFSQFNPSKNFSMADSDDSYLSSDLDSDDSDLDFDGSDDDTDTSGFCSSRNTNAAMGVRIEYKTAHEAEAFDLERTKKVNPAPMPDEEDDLKDRLEHDRVIRQGSAPEQHISKFRAAVLQHKEEIIKKGHLITKDEHITEVLPETKDSFNNTTVNTRSENETLKELFPFGFEELTIKNGQIDIKSIEKNKRSILNQIKNTLTADEIKKLNCFSMKDIDIDGQDYVNEKIVNVGFDTKEGYEEVCRKETEFIPYYEEGKSGKEFDFDHQPVLEGHPGPSPSVILQALTMSNANDGINLERLETIGDSFLKFAITAYLYCAHPTVHEGKLSHMRSKQVSNLNLYRLGRNKRLGARMIASKFEPHDNWLPPCHKPPPTLHPRINGEGKDIMQHLDTPLDSAGCFIPYNLITQHSIPDKSIADCVEALIGAYLLECGPRGALLFMSWLGIRVLPCHHVSLPDTHPYVRRMEKTEKESQETTASSPTPIRQRRNSSSSSCSDEDSSTQEVFPEEDWSWPGRAVGSLQPYKDEQGNWMQPIFGALKAPPSPLLRYIEDPEGELEMMLSGYDALERTLQYRFKDRSLLLQALTHASHHSNRLTDCYQRLEFLGDAILDYLITRHLYEDPRRHSPGALTDLRSALVNNTIFATLAARHGFHKYFRHMSPGLNEVLTKYVKIQEENGHSISEEHYLIQEDEMEQAEDVEVPKALGDLFESVAGAIFLDSGMSLGAVWKSYVNLMGAELEAFSAAAPKSPVRELLEAEPDTAKFGKPERLADGRRVRVCVEVFGRGTFKGVGRNYRIAKGTAARCALRHLKVHRAR